MRSANSVFLLVTILARCCLTEKPWQFSFFHEMLKNFNREIFIYESKNYKDWSDWSPCSTSCDMYRERECGIEQGNVGRRALCPVIIIREFKSCEKCHEDDEIPISKSTLASLPQNCGLNSRSELRRKIYGGRPASKDAWPWMISIGIQHSSNVHHICGATLISRHWALTAAHCVDNFLIKNHNFGRMVSFKNKNVVATIYNYRLNQKDENEYRISITHGIIHPHYYHNSTTNDNDFALLLLDVNNGRTRENPFQHGFPCLSDDSNFFLPLNSRCYAIGWGGQSGPSDKNPTAYDDRLYEVEMPLIANTPCQNYYKGIAINPTIHICAGGNQRDTCNGDSGGGLFCIHPINRKWMFYGIISFGTDKGCGEQIGVYARISGAIGWIDDTIRLATLGD